MKNSTHTIRQLLYTQYINRLAIINLPDIKKNQYLQVGLAIYSPLIEIGSTSDVRTTIGHQVIPLLACSYPLLEFSNRFLVVGKFEAKRKSCVFGVSCGDSYI